MICSSCILNRGAQEDSFIAKRQLSFLTPHDRGFFDSLGQGFFRPPRDQRYGFGNFTRLSSYLRHLMHINICNIQPKHWVLCLLDDL